MVHDSLKQLHDTLQRYSGWLGRERASATVRADVVALGAALDARADPSPLLDTLDANIERLHSGALRKIIRTAAGELRSALAEGRD